MTSPDHRGPEGAVASRRVDGFVPIEDYATLGDGRTVALVAADGCIDWWPVPAMDSPPVFAAVLDPANGGCLVVAPVEDYTVTRQYVPGTNVLETTFTTASGVVKVVDALAVGIAGPLPWGELIRRVDGVEGAVEMHWLIRAGDRFGSAQAWTEPADGVVMVHVGDQHLGVRCVDVGTPEVSLHELSGRFRTSPDSSGLLGITTADAEPLFLPGPQTFAMHLDRTVSRWQEWSDPLEYDGPWQSAVIRSALALKTLIYSPSGAIAAAATTSLPERVGGDKNWDYRYMWLRDASFTVDALITLGLHEEVQSAVSFTLDVLRRHAPDLPVFASLSGDTQSAESQLDAPGYRDSRPVRSGNGAADQLQLGTFGDLFDTIWHYVDHGHHVDPATGRLLEALADRCCDVWLTPDAGIWELHDNQHYTISKLGCWVALDRAARLADKGAIATGHAGRWTGERDRIKAWVDEHCWSSAKSSYTFYAGTEDLDAATLLAGRAGFDRGDRLAGTLAAVREELAVGPLIYRYSGMQQEEGAFLACTFWAVIAMTHVGQHDEAVALMDEAVALANDVGLLAEQMDPATRGMLGNVPQALSHLALINAAVALNRSGS